jgi:membrane-bound serine protease (ClpP class)
MSTARAHRQARTLRLLLSAVLLAAPLLSIACSGGPGSPPGSVHVLTIPDDTVNPVMDRYLDRGIDAAEDEEATAVVIRLDTPGGLVTSMDDIVQRILASRVPVIVYVTPSGGQAASAGTYITYASHVAAMAPGTTIGAATPVSGSGEDLGEDLRNKVVENAVAKIRGLAELRGRNADWAEDAVRNGTSATATDAFELGVIEYIATDLDDLLAQVDGVTVELQDGEETVLETGSAEIAYNDQNFVERFLGILADPNIAFLLLSLGSLAIFIEIIHPGAIFPGVFGAIALLFGFFALSVIPFNWAGVALILLAFVLFGLELFVTSGGVLGAGGIVALILGGSLLTSGNPPGFQVSPWVVWPFAAVLGGLVIFVFVNVFRVRRMPAVVGAESAVGRRVVARSPLDPTGMVMMDGEYWTAESEEGNIGPGEAAIVTEIKGLKLKVRKQDGEGADDVPPTSD